MGVNAFKTNQRTPRQVVTEESYSKGMQYTNAPLAEGFCKTLLNYDLKDSGTVLTPRSGYQLLHTAVLEKPHIGSPQTIHHTGMATITNTSTGEDISRRYIFNACEDGNGEFFEFEHGTTVLEGLFSPDFEDPNQFVFPVPHALPKAGYYLIRQRIREKPQMLHDISLLSNDVFTHGTYLPIYAHLNGTPIVPVRCTVDDEGTITKNGYAKMILETNGSGAYTNRLEFIDPKEVSPTEAINYGYNMLKENPYTFTDELSAAVGAGYIILKGVLPYADEACQTLKFNAHVGEPITFRLFADFGNYTDTFKFRWEIRELGSEKITVYEDQTTTGNVYRLTDAAVDHAINTADSSSYIKLTIAPPYKQFSVTVTAYASTDTTEPVQVMTLASYSLTADSAGSTQNLTPRTYAISAATDMCAWRQRIVLWGIPGAPNTLFLSDINDPSYFPYPNNCEVFDEEVISCKAYLNALLVFTATKLYKISLSTDGLTFSSDMVQDKLSLSPFDKETITLVQNMVYFKNGNYFYMVVPRTSSAQAGALQMAPISNPITYLLDHFNREVKDIVFTLYNPLDERKFPSLGPDEVYDIRIQDYYNYLDTYVIRNVYKYELYIRNTETNTVPSVLLTFDFVLNYDTVARTWTIYLYQSNAGRIIPYRQTVTDATIYTQLRTEDSLYVDFIKPRTLYANDNFPLTLSTLIKSRLLKNHQMLDTGYRDHNTPIKKRYREIQFRIGTANQKSLEFGTEFMIDEQIRKDLYTYEVSQVTDPTASDYGYIYVQRNFADPIVTAGATILKEDDDTLYLPSDVVVSDDTVRVTTGSWVLDVSQLANVVSSKVRFSVSGKGYSPRLILLSFNEIPYDLMSHAWVFRTMNAR